MIQKLRTRLIFLYIGSFTVSLLPLLILFIVNWDKYTTSPSDTIKLCIGGIMCLIFAFLILADKLKMPNRIVLCGVLFIIVYLLKAVLEDLLLICAICFISSAVDWLIFQQLIKKTKQDILIQKTANTTTAQVEEAVKKIIGSGRV